MIVLLLLVTEIFSLSTCCRQASEFSKEWQIEMQTELLHPRDLGIQRLFQYLQSIEASPVGKQYGFKVKSSVSDVISDQRQVRHFDTTGNDFVNSGIVLRFRKWLSTTDDTIPDAEFIAKGKNNLAPLAYNQPLSNGYAAINMNCSAKLEQDLHVSRANYALSTVLTGANMLSFLGDNAQNLKSVDPLAALYPDLYQITSCALGNITKSTPLVVSDQYLFVMSKIKLEFAHKHVHADLTLEYNSASDAQQGLVKPISAELSWRMKSTDDNWSCDVWLASMAIQQTIAKSLYASDPTGPITWSCDI